MQHNFLRSALLCGLLALGGIVQAGEQAETVLTDIDQAVKVAQAKQLPVFIDFSAIWCHSCHEMDAKVLNGAEWDQRQSRFVLVRSDADSANGEAWMKKLGVPALPTYVMLNPDGSERGRLTGEFTREKFYPALDRLISGADALSKLQDEAMNGSKEALAKVLGTYFDRRKEEEGLRWYEGLPAPVRDAAKSDPDVATRLAMIRARAEMDKLLEGMRRDQVDAAVRKETDAKKRKAILEMAGALPPALPADRRDAIAADCRAHAAQALDGPLGIDERFQVAGTLLSCAAPLPDPARKALASEQLAVLKPLYDAKVPTAGSGVLRGATYTLASYYKALGDSVAEKATYRDAIAIARKALDDGHGGLDVRRDQAMAQVYGEFVGRYGSPDDGFELQKAMVEVYPDNASYQNSYGNSLLKRGDAVAALPHLQRAVDNAAARDKLGYTLALARTLVALNRRPEAEKLFNAALKAAEQQFPADTRMMMAYWKESGSLF